MFGKYMSASYVLRDKMWKLWTSNKKFISSEGGPVVVGENYPYPKLTVENEATGVLAQRIRQAFGVMDDTARVLLIENVIYEGYSEYTQENYGYLQIKCEEFEKEFNCNCPYVADDADKAVEKDSNTLLELLAWLDEKAPQ